jgi:hypothetical protein
VVRVVVEVVVVVEGGDVEAGEVEATEVEGGEVEEGAVETAGVGAGEEETAVEEVSGEVDNVEDIPALQETAKVNKADKQNPSPVFNNMVSSPPFFRSYPPFRFFILWQL